MPVSTATKDAAADAGEVKATRGTRQVFVFLQTDDFWRDYNAFVARGVVFVRTPTEEPYGTVAVFKDLYGNLFDLIGRKA